MTAVFADAVYLIALTDRSDNLHVQALRLTDAVMEKSLVTTDEVLTEYVNHFSGRDGRVRGRICASVRRMVEFSDVRVIPQSRASFLAGLRLYEKRSDKGYSLTDYISMETMRREDLTEVLTNERHFEQEGFRALFRV